MLNVSEYEKIVTNIFNPCPDDFNDNGGRVLVGGKK